MCRHSRATGGRATEVTLSLAEAKSPPVPVGDHRQLLPRRQDLKMETGAALEQAGKG